MSDIATGTTSKEKEPSKSRGKGTSSSIESTTNTKVDAAVASVVENAQVAVEMATSGMSQETSAMELGGVRLVDPSGANGSSDGDAELNEADLVAGEAEIVAELDVLSGSGKDLLDSGLGAEVAQARATAEQTRNTFLQLPRDERAKIILRRRALGTRIANRTFPGAPTIVQNVVLRHSRLRPVFEQWWPFFNRMTLNIVRYGTDVFDKSELKTLNTYFETSISKLEESVQEQLRVAAGFKESQLTRLETSKSYIFEPNVQLPSTSAEVTCFSPLAFRFLKILRDFDEIMDIFDWYVWNGVRDQSLLDDDVKRFLRRYMEIGLRGYTTHLKLMAPIRKHAA